MEEKSVFELFTDIYTDDPVNWIKWVIVFAVLILGYFIAVPVYKKVSYLVSWERKADIARSRNHVIKSELVSSFPSGDVGDYTWHGKYKYRLNGEEKIFRALFMHGHKPPLYLYLYYITNPRRVFSPDEYHWQNHKAIVLLPVILLPWILALIAVIVLKAEFNG